MKSLSEPEIECYRLKTEGGDAHGGAFMVLSEKRTWHSKKKTMLCVIASSLMDWDHVSVSTKNRCPTWEEMEQIKRLFFKETEVAYQLHLSPAQHINVHPHVLHIWRPQHDLIPLPPTSMV